MPDQFCLFTTLRFTCPDRCGVFGPDNAQNRTFITKGDVPLIDRHIARLRTAHAHYVNHEGESKWGTWPGDEQVWEAIHAVLQNIADEGPGDYRVRVLLHPGARLEVQTPAAPRDAGPLTLGIPTPPYPSPTALSPSFALQHKRRPLILDPQLTDLSLEGSSDLSKRRYKTTSREMYDAATSRALARALADTPPGCEVLLWTKEERLLETCTSNIALWMHHSDVGAGGGVWVTPRLDREEEMAPEGARAVFLDGVVRQELLSKGLIMEGEVTVQDLELCREEGRPVIGFNGLRGVWQADLL